MLRWTLAGIVQTVFAMGIHAVEHASKYLYVDVSAGAGGAWTITEISDVPADLLTNDVWRTDRILLRKIPAGSFVMGSPTNELGRNGSETQHAVTLTKPFYMGVFEVTQKQYERLTGTTPSYFAGHPKRPVERVAWPDVRGGAWPNGSPAPESCMGRLRQKLPGRFFDLPTEAQWEYACRAGTTRAFNDQTKNAGEGSACAHSGAGEDVNLNPLAWYQFNSNGETHDVGGKRANAWGLYDMHGNVWEWCLDWYGPFPGDVRDPVGAASGPGRLLRGGYWLNLPVRCRSADRYDGIPDYGSYFRGFRLACPAGQE